MGYRSDVGLVLSKSGVESLRSKLASPETKEDVREAVSSLLNRADTHYADKESGAEVWYWSCIKWYGGGIFAYPAISFIEDAMYDMDRDNFYFIRIGEEYDDTEVRGYFWDNPFEMDLIRDIGIQPAA